MKFDLRKLLGLNVEQARPQAQRGQGGTTDNQITNRMVASGQLPPSRAEIYPQRQGVSRPIPMQMASQGYGLGTDDPGYDLQSGYDQRSPQPTYQSHLQMPVQGGMMQEQNTFKNPIQYGKDTRFPQARQSNWFDY